MFLDLLMPDYLDEFLQDLYYLWDKNLLFGKSHKKTYLSYVAVLYEFVRCESYMEMYDFFGGKGHPPNPQTVRGV